MIFFWELFENFGLDMSTFKNWSFFQMNFVNFKINIT